MEPPKEEPPTPAHGVQSKWPGQLPSLSWPGHILAVVVLGRTHGFRLLPRVIQTFGKWANQTLAAGFSGPPGIGLCCLPGWGIHPTMEVFRFTVLPGISITSRSGALCSPQTGFAYKDNFHQPNIPATERCPWTRHWHFHSFLLGAPVEREQAFFLIPSLSLTHMFIRGLAKCKLAFAKRKRMHSKWERWGKSRRFQRLLLKHS